MCTNKKKTQSVPPNVVADICTIVVANIYTIAITVAYIHTIASIDIRMVAEIDILTVAVTIAYMCSNKNRYSYSSSSIYKCNSRNRYPYNSRYHTSNIYAIAVIVIYICLASEINICVVSVQ